MSHTDRLRGSPATFRRLTGITPAAFARVLAALEPRYVAADTKREARPGRMRKPGAGREHALPLADRLLMLLMYYRTYTTHAFPGFLFGVDDSTAGRNINPLQPLLAGVFRIPERKVAIEPEDLGELFPTPPSGRSRGRPGAEAVLQREEEAAHGQEPGGRDPAAEAVRPRCQAPAGADPGGVPDARREDG